MTTLKKSTDLSVREKTARILDWITEKKGRDMLALDLSGLAGFAESLIIVTATSVRQAQALADDILERCKQEHIEFLHMEGYNSGQWILLDLNDVVVNIFQAEARELFNLEGLWSGARIIDDRRSASLTASEDE